MDLLIPQPWSEEPMRTIRSMILIICVLYAPSTFGQENARNLSSNTDGMWGFQTPSPYKILPRTVTHSNKGQPNTSLPVASNIESKPMQPYAYGWFGTKSSPQWSRQFGHQKAYTQWTLR